MGANSGLPPESSVLVEVLGTIQPSERAMVATKWERWRGPLVETGRAEWTEVLRYTEACTAPEAAVSSAFSAIPPVTSIAPPTLPSRPPERPAPLLQLLR